MLERLLPARADNVRRAGQLGLLMLLVLEYAGRRVAGLMKPIATCTPRRGRPATGRCSFWRW